MKLPNFSKQTLAIAGIVIIGGAVAGASALTSPQQTGAADTTPIQQQVNKNTDQLNNHEARITNSENDIKDLQGSTNTPPGSNRISVPIASPVQAPVPTVTVADYKQIVIDSDNTDCMYTYSDGTTSQWHWKTLGQDAWVTDGVGQNGHWVHTTQSSGVCDSSAIGRTKS